MGAPKETASCTTSYAMQLSSIQPSPIFTVIQMQWSAVASVLPPHRTSVAVCGAWLARQPLVTWVAPLQAVHANDAYASVLTQTGRYSTIPSCVLIPTARVHRRHRP